MDIFLLARIHKTSMNSKIRNRMIILEDSLMFCSICSIHLRLYRVDSIIGLKNISYSSSMGISQLSYRKEELSILLVSSKIFRESYKKNKNNPSITKL